ncbi:MAG: response regulator [Clostridiales bacterium]|jgi:two-component system response regulator YesN|nr:response regulator [Clostridiales bacterium]
MYKAFLVDDEPSVIEGLKLMISWNDLGFVLCGDASDGYELLGRLELLRPHLIVTDIRMPSKNGLELIKELRKSSMATECIIFSGYPEFVYAQAAIRLNVKHYLLKPLDADEFSDALRAVKKDLDKEFLLQTDILRNPDDSAALPSSKIKAPNKSLSAEKENDVFWMERSDSFADEFSERLKASVQLMDSVEAKKLITEIFFRFRSSSISLPQAQIIINSSVYHVLHVAFERNLKLDPLLARTGEGRNCSFDALKKYIEGISLQTIKMLLEDRKYNSRRYLRLVEKYISSHFKDEITVTMLAEMVFLDPEHLGKVFHKEYGCSISEYQHKLRIEKAAELLKSSNMTLGEVSLEVGYNHYNKFFANFEKYMHMKPIQFKNS